MTLTVQVEPAVNVAPVRLMLLLPAVAVATLLGQSVASPFGDATNNPTGNESVKETPVNVVVVFGFVIEKVTCTGTFTGTDTQLKDLLIAGGFATISVAVAKFPRPRFDVTWPVALFLVPSVKPTTDAVIVQDPPATMLAFTRLMLPLPAVAVTVPLAHVLVKPLGVATTTPAGSVSVKPTPVTATVGFGLVIVKLNVDVPPVEILLGVKLLEMEGGPVTTSVATAELPIP